MAWRAGYLAPIALLALGALVAPLGVAASGPTVWSSQADFTAPVGTTVNTQALSDDGSKGLVHFHYDYELCPNPSEPSSACGGPGVSLKTWEVTALAAAGERIQLNWTWTGFHGYASVTTKLEGIVYDNPGGSVIHTDTLASGGPVSCCTTPSAGFAYSGTEYLDVSAGNSFGFKVYGSNGDLNSRLIGDLKIAYNVVSNPSFELGNLTTSQELHRLAPGSTALPSWTVEDRTIPLQNNAEVDWTGEWPAPDGFRSVDLDGAPSSGGIRQDVATIPGESYTLSFQYSANPNRLVDPLPGECNGISDPAVQFAAYWDGHELNGGVQYVYSDFNNASSLGEMKWKTATETVTATSASTPIQFESTDTPSHGCGPVIDNVSLIPVLPPTGSDPAQAGPTFVVNTAVDHLMDGCGQTDCTLREAIHASNQLPSSAAHPNHISFAIPGASTTIALTTNAEALLNPVVIDGTTQSGAACPQGSPAGTLKIEVTAAGGYSGGLPISAFSSAGGSTIKGLIIDGFSSDAISLGDEGSSSGFTITCNVIGTSAHPNGSAGISLSNVSNSRVGADLSVASPALADMNVITHNKVGIAIPAPGPAIASTATSSATTPTSASTSVATARRRTTLATPTTDPTTSRTPRSSSEPKADPAAGWAARSTRRPMARRT